jgi:hypothetical protein
MVSQAGGRLLQLDAHSQVYDDQFRLQVVTHRPADDFAGEEIEPGCRRPPENLQLPSGKAPQE